MTKLVAKYRPRSLDNMIGQEKIMEISRRWLDRQEMPDVRLIGPSGTGKTTWAYAFFSELAGGFDIWNEKHPYLLELNASDDRGIEVVRGTIKDFAMASLNPSIDMPFKVVLLDEADQVTHIAQNALRNTVEKYEDRCRFWFLGNEDNFIDAMVSRSALLTFAPLPNKVCFTEFNRIAEAEGVKFADHETIQEIVDHYHGDLRKMLNDQLEKLIGIDYPVTIDDLDFSDSMAMLAAECLGKLVGDGDARKRYLDARKWFTKKHASMKFDIRDFIKELHGIMGPMSFDIAKTFSEVDDRIRGGGIKDIHVGYLFSVIANAKP